MTKFIGFGALLLGVLLLVPEQGEGQNKDMRKATVVQATAQDYKNLAKELTGIIASADAKSLTFRLDYSRTIPNVKKGRVFGAKVLREYKEFTFDVDSAVVVKKKFVAPEYDNKGNYVINEAAAKELKAKGFIASKIDDIRSGNVATLTFVPAKKQEKVEGAGNVPVPVVKSIVLVQEGTPVEQTRPPEKKKKN
jgi:hypothetical protein